MNEQVVKIKIDIEELMDKLTAMLEDDYVSAKLILTSDGYDTELEVIAVGIEEEENLSYGSLEGMREEIM